MCIPDYRDNKNFCKGRCIGVSIGNVIYVLFVIFRAVFIINVARANSSANNIFDNNYQKFLNFQVQGLQALIGATYKFDF